MISPLKPASPSRLRRYARVSAGFALLLPGMLLLVTPGPGMPLIFVGLTLLKDEFFWAQTLLGRLRAGTDELQRQFVRRSSDLRRAREVATDWGKRVGQRGAKGTGDVPPVGKGPDGGP